MVHREASEGSFDQFEIGDQVRHPKWGVGTILYRSGSGDRAKAIVVFPEEGQKKLLLKFAKLRKLGDTRVEKPAPAPAPRIVPQVKVEKPPKGHEEEVEETDEEEEEEDLKNVFPDGIKGLDEEENEEEEETEEDEKNF
ncbi:MAG: hypothetical protein V2A74_11010 [bacterium]